MMKLFALLTTVWISCSVVVDGQTNFLFFVADDLGIGDVGCFGNSDIPTPNIDRLCREGAQLSHHLAAAAVCTPSRAAFMTGRYAARAGLDADGSESAPVLIYPFGRAGLAHEETTWASVLKGAGYATAAVGKWHLGWDRDSCGDNLHGPLGHGFDYFFGLPHSLEDGMQLDVPFWSHDRILTNLQNSELKHWMTFVLSLTVAGAISKAFRGTSLLLVLFACFVLLQHFSLKPWYSNSPYANRHLNSFLVENTTVVEWPIVLEGVAANLTRRSLEFIARSVKDGEKFALFHSFTNVHTPLVTGEGFPNTYGGSVMEMDHQVGRILDLLEELNVADDTFVYFTSDHGAAMSTGGGSNRPHSGWKSMGAMEGAIRVPAAVRWPRRVKPNSKVASPTSLMDLFPTVAEIAGVDDVKDDLDGRSIYGKLVEGEDQDDDRVLRHYCGTRLQALRITHRSRVYKAYFFRHRLSSDGSCGKAICSCFDNVDDEGFFAVHDVEADPEERHPLDPQHPLYEELSRRFKREFEKASSETFPPSQLTSPWLVLPRPWMMPPFCG